MSAGFGNGISKDLVSHINSFWGKRQDTVVNIMGAPDANGQRIPLAEDVKKWVSQRPNPTNVGNWKALMDGSTDNTSLVKEVIEFIEKNFDPRGRLVLSGTSRGAMNVLQVCRVMAANARFFKLHRLTSAIDDSAAKGKFVAQTDASPFTVTVGIDLICIMDATFDVERVEVQKKVPSIVLQYANWFQTIEDNSGAHASLMPVAPADTVKIKDEHCNKRIPGSSIWPFGSAHDHVCKVLAPPEVDKLVVAELNKPSPQLTPAPDRKGAQLRPPRVHLIARA